MEDIDIATNKPTGEPDLGLARRGFLLGALSLLFLAPTTPAIAQRPPRAGRRGRRRRLRRLRRRAIRRFRERDPAMRRRARQAVRRGEIRPLREVMAIVAQRSNAEVLDVDVHETDEGWVYALRVLTRGGRVRDVYLDATTLDVLSIEGDRPDDGVPPPRKDFPRDNELDRPPLDVPPPPRRPD